jgi:hypothetical protein
MKHAVRTVIRLIVAGIIIVGGMNVGLEYVRHRMHGTETSLLRVGLGMLGVVLGLILVATSSSLAERMTDDFEE